MASVPCPRCGAPVGYEENGCSPCREEKRLKRRPKLIAAGLAAAAFAVLAWTARGSAAWRDFAAEVERTRDPAGLAAKGDPVPLAAAVFPAPAQTSVSSFVYAGGAPPDAFLPQGSPPEAAAPAPEQDKPAVAAPVPPPPNRSMRRWYGVVYDLSTLKPVAGAVIRFRGSDPPLESSATTDAAGRYSFDIFKSNGKVSADIAPLPGYRAGLLADHDPPLRERPRDARRRILEETTDSDLEPVPLRYREGVDVTELDLVLIPSAKK